MLVKEALRDSSPLVFLSIRFLVAGAVLLAVWRGARLSHTSLRAGLLLGVFLFVGMFLQTLGLKYTTPSKSAFLTAFSVILVPLFLAFWGANIRTASWLGAGLGLTGIYFLVRPSGFGTVNFGDIVTLLAAISFAFHIILVGSRTQRFPFRQLVTVQVLAVGLLSALALPLEQGRMLRLTWPLAAIVVFTALLGVGFCFSVQNWAQQFTPAAHAALIFSLEPVFAAIASYLVGAEQLTGMIVSGSALILAGLVVSELWGGRPPSPIES